MSLAARRPTELGYHRRGVRDSDLIELVERTHRYCRGGPMYLCNDEDCMAWVDALREWGVIR